MTKRKLKFVISMQRCSGFNSKKTPSHSYMDIPTYRLQTMCPLKKKHREEMAESHGCSLLSSMGTPNSIPMPADKERGTEKERRQDGIA